MDNLEKQYEEILINRKTIIEQLKKLEENEVLKKYFELRKKNEELYDKQIKLYKEMKEEKYA
jgi:hypothetical protein